MKCPYCLNDIGFLHFKDRFKCPVCGRSLVLKGVSDHSIIPEIIISTIVLSVLPIPESGIFSWLIPFVYVLIVFLLFIVKGAHLEPDE